MLTVNDVAKDYDAVISSIEHLKGIFGPNSPWPADGLTLEEDLAALNYHQKEFLEKSSFAYTVMNLDESQCLGCVYIMPSDNRLYGAMVVMWIRKSELSNGLDEELFSGVASWINKEWPFKNAAYPGRKISWDEFLLQD
ncbi:MAG: GNAT family N-acetyltransferase [Patescibacteria group bacterium]